MLMPPVPTLPLPPGPRLCSLLAFGVGMLFPTLESFKAIESKQLGDDTQVPARSPRLALLTAEPPRGPARWRRHAAALPPASPPLRCVCVTCWLCFTVAPAVADVLGVLLGAALRGAGGLALPRLVRRPAPPGGWRATCVPLLRGGRPAVAAAHGVAPWCCRTRRRIPLYRLLRVGALAWLALPQTRVRPAGALGRRLLVRC